MQKAAKDDGLNIEIYSGFRSLEKQSKLFYDKAKQKGLTEAERAKLSAPPGYSEHHTGYAVDLKDGNIDAPLGHKFAQTKIYSWLLKNAKNYGFELSFPKNNPQHVDDEPWHWRFVGDEDSQATFATVKNLIK